MPRRSGKQAETFSVREVPYEGQVGAGRLPLAFVPKDGIVAVPVPDSIPKSDHLATMTVNGNSLERVGIFDGDIVLVRQITSKRQIKRNSVCVVYVPSLGEPMAKKVSFDGDYLVLHYCGMDPQEPMYVLAEEAEIRGIVISVTRQATDWPFVDQVPAAPSGVALSPAAKARILNRSPEEKKKAFKP
jgi:SOS-response transcriptional repressor LexA